MPEALARLADLSSRYDAVLCDIWGVVHDGRRAFAEAVAALKAWRAAGGTVVLVSNVPKPRDPIPEQLLRLGAPADCYDAIVTSGDAIRAELAVRAPGPMLKIGPPEDADLWAGLDLARTERIEDAAFVAISGLVDHIGAEPSDYASLLAAAKARDLELLCANPDIVVRFGQRLLWCAGAIARDYAQIGGRVVMAGKPHPPIYALALAEVTRLRGAPLARDRILAIGDGVGTDVLGANLQDIDVLFVAAGIHGEALVGPNGSLDPAKVEQALAAEGARARYITRSLA